MATKSLRRMQRGPAPAARQILSQREVTELTGLSKTAIYVSMAERDFPRSVRVLGRKVGWLRADIDAWIARLVADRDKLERIGAAS